jgi:hypothetical protein
MGQTRKTQGMNHGGTKKPRGRTSISHVDPVDPTRPDVPQVRRSAADRPVSAGTGKHRGDRRDMSKTYSGNTSHASRGNNPRVDVKTRSR